jgi:hypothetical protein
MGNPLSQCISLAPHEVVVVAVGITAAFVLTAMRNIAEV